jgi:hypothetical protein
VAPGDGVCVGGLSKHNWRRALRPRASPQPVASSQEAERKGGTRWRQYFSKRVPWRTLRGPWVVGVQRPGPTPDHVLWLSGVCISMSTSSDPVHQNVTSGKTVGDKHVQHCRSGRNFPQSRMAQSGPSNNIKVHLRGTRSPAMLWDDRAEVDQSWDGGSEALTAGTAR